MRQNDRNALLLWEELKSSLKKSTPIDYNESAVDKKKRIAALEAEPEDWFVYYFPTYAYADPADFQKKATRRVIANDNWYEVRAWARELAKDTRTMFEVLYLTLVKKERNVLLVSYSHDNAANLLDPYRLNLEANPRIINDYGHQVKHGKWEQDDFTTLHGVSMRAVGALESPRGTKNEHARPDILVISDIDNDETVRNPEQVKKRWEWVEKALIPTVSVSGHWRILFLNNIIAKYCCVTEACKLADKVDIVNIRDKNGKSTWPAKNTEEMIDRILSKLSYRAQQGEYFNNPITQGTVFKEIYYKQLPALHMYKFLLAYGDPSFKDGKKNDYKALALVGQYKDEFHVLKMFCEQTSTATMASWYKAMKDFVGGKTPLYMYCEANATQDLILAQVNKHIFEQNWGFAVSADERQKGDKFSRIESLLEPLNREQKLCFNAKEKDDQHMKRTEDQFLALEPQLSGHDDAPDAVHGGISLVQEKMAHLTHAPIMRKVHYNPKRF